MTGALLRTGSLEVFHPLGADGNPVHAAAAQLRAALGRRLGQDVADTFAIPQRNEDGDTIDWYAPRSAAVIPWSSATEHERVQAKERLTEVCGRVDRLGREMAMEVDPQRQAFGRLLEQVTVFPDEEHVYLVDGSPVVTFWGFRHHNAPAYSGAMLDLDALRADRQPVTGGRAIPWWLWLLGLLLLLALLLFLLRGCLSEEPEPLSAPAVAPTETVAPAAVSEVQEEPAPLPETPVEPLLEAELQLEPEPPNEAGHRDLQLGRDAPGAIILDQDRVIRDRMPGGLRTDVVPAETGVIAEPTEDVTLDAGSGEQGPLQDGDGVVPLQDIGAGIPEAVSLPGTEAGVETERMEVAVDGEVPAVEPREPITDLAQDPSPEPGEALQEEAAVDAPAPEAGQEELIPPEPQQDAQGPAEASRSPETDPSTGENLDQVQQIQAEGGAQSSPPDQAQPPKPGQGAADLGTGNLRPQPLTIPADAIRSGSIRFTDGGWRTSTSLQDARGLPVDMRYQLKDGAGKVELERHDGTVCAADVKAVMRDGKLVIDSAAEIRCPDGTNFGRPSMECKSGRDGQADCVGRYSTGESFSVDMSKSP